jgi:hypothetical protein
VSDRRGPQKKSDVEGSLFLVERRTSPVHRVIVMNKLSRTNLLLDMVPGMQAELKGQLVILTFPEHVSGPCFAILYFVLVLVEENCGLLSRGCCVLCAASLRFRSCASAAASNTADGFVCDERSYSWVCRRPEPPFMDCGARNRRTAKVLLLASQLLLREASQRLLR